LLFRPEAGPGGLQPGVLMSLVAWNHHYIRDGEGVEELYDLSTDPFEKLDWSKAADRGPILSAFRAMLLDVLDESPGSTEVERAYLKDYRKALRAQVDRRTVGQVASESPAASPDRPRGSGRPDS
jgi:hypothetical protein